jgi:putative nucleotidyltransferase with HDIG domain
MGSDRIRQIEAFVRQTMDNTQHSDQKIAHDFKHVDRVRRRALAIAAGEGFADLELLEAAALLHDIGLAHAEKRSDHAQVGARVAARFLQAQRTFSEQENALIVGAVRDHNSIRDLGPLATILRDADILDMLGAVGVMRAFTSQYAKPEYDPQNVKGETWRMTARDVDRRFAEGQGIGRYIVDQINFQASCYGNLQTGTARQIAAPLVEYMRAFLIQLESEVGASHVIRDQDV